VNLNQFVSDLRTRILGDLLTGHEPSEGEFSQASFGEGRDTGGPKMGPFHFTPDTIILDFLFSSRDAGVVVLTVTVTAPERIVYMPVPEWVIEQIWQGEVYGSYKFESEAVVLLGKFRELLEPEVNRLKFGPPQSFVRN
jgi:hypothetical protein